MFKSNYFQLHQHFGFKHNLLENKNKQWSYKIIAGLESRLTLHHQAVRLLMITFVPNWPLTDQSIEVRVIVVDHVCKHTTPPSSGTMDHPSGLTPLIGIPLTTLHHQFLTQNLLLAPCQILNDRVTYVLNWWSFDLVHVFHYNTLCVWAGLNLHLEFTKWQIAVFYFYTCLFDNT